MPKPVDIDTRAVMVLQREAERMAAAAERVRLVVQAMALRRGVSPREIAQEDVDLLA